jgi:hypothetical protein
VVGDGGWADEQLSGDLRVGGAFAGQAGDERLLRGQGVARRDGALAGLAAAATSTSRWVADGRSSSRGR